ncbi:MAG: DUF1638 domain-containing protein [bacterium]|nr:DUF1638 domain-containing protein [bacterium]MXV91613.1 DUF1638 domain-containing protein [Acidimicrobiia bacterium]MYC45163.1 DUF1638 domain-containing protein [Acidimicrobiia bacterium]MYI20061.1 DUF1638 domain-containing protein [Acidimicrobiia bacterium]
MTRSGAPAPDRVLVIACGALARELAVITAALDGLDFECLPARLHNRPEQIPEAVRRRVRAARDSYDTILVGYMDCGTGGLLDRVCEEEGVERLPGAHCYELYAGAERFSDLQEAEPGTFYLTDYLVRHFDRLILEGLGIADHPELRDVYFCNYTRVVHLAQEPDGRLEAEARSAAAALGLRYERIVTGYGGLAAPLQAGRRLAARAA